MARIGLIAMSAKPYHAGHDGLVRLASQENDEVHLYVSTSDRARPGEIPILGADMALLWKETIEPSLPKNVKVVYGGSPVGNVWKELGAADQSGSKDIFSLYADPADLAQTFEEKLLKKYCGNLLAAGQIKLRAVERSSTVDVSGTAMRSYLEKGDKASFVSKLPKTIDRDKVWDVLSRTAADPPRVKRTAGPVRKKAPAAPQKQVQPEGILRRYIRLVLGR